MSETRSLADALRGNFVVAMTVCDHDETMYSSLASCAQPNQPRERFILGAIYDWLA
jgi:hypothetical protein